MSDEPAICFKPATTCVASFMLNGHRYEGCTTFDPNPNATSSHKVQEWCSHVTHYVWGSTDWSYCLKVPCIDTSTPSTLFTPEGMTRSVLLNVCVLAAATAMLGLWLLSMQFTKRVQRGMTNAFSYYELEPIEESPVDKVEAFIACVFGRSIKVGPELHSTARNYLVFLHNSRDMFIAMTIFSFLSALCVGKQRVFLFGCVPGPISLMEDATATSLAVVCINALVLGLIVYVFTVRFERHCERGHHKIVEDMGLVKRTLWITQIPYADSQTRECFRLNNEELKQVEEDLRMKIKEDLQKKVAEDRELWGHINPETAIEHLFVTPVIDTWHATVCRMKNYEALARDYHHRATGKTAYCQWLRKKEIQWLKHKEASCLGHFERLKKEAKDLEETGLKELSGSAFVVFNKENEEALRCLMGPDPGCLACRKYTYWRFGRAPFSSVTLRCQPAPHPSNLNWENLRVSDGRRWFGYITGRLLLMISMLLLVTPVAVTSELNLGLHMLQTHTKIAEHWISDRLVHVKLSSAINWAHLSEQLPTIALVLINSIVLPPIIGMVADWQRPPLKSKEEKVQLHLNYFFLVLNQIVIPLLGLSGLPALAMIVKEEVGDVQKHNLESSLSWVEACLAAVFSSPAAFSIKYLLNCAFMTAANSLLNLPQYVIRRLIMQEAEPWSFSYGYWYAFSMGILALGFGMGIYVPSLLPCALLFFYIRHKVDRYNITTRAYVIGLESLGSFSKSVQRMLKTTVSLWWISIGSGVLLYMHTFFENTWDSPVPRIVVKGLAFSLVCLGLVLVPAVMLWDVGQNAGLHWEASHSGEAHHSQHFAPDDCWGKLITCIFGQLHQPGTTPRNAHDYEDYEKDLQDLPRADIGTNSESAGYKHTKLEPQEWDVRVFLQLAQQTREKRSKRQLGESI